MQLTRPFHNLNLATGGLRLITDLSEISAVLTDYFATRPEVRILTIFGSFASGNAHAASDLYLAIDTGQRLSPDELAQMTSELATRLGREVDLVDLTVSRGAILEEAIIKGRKVIQRSPEDFARLLKRMWYDKEDDGRYRQRTMQTRLLLWKQ